MAALGGCAVGFFVTLCTQTDHVAFIPDQRVCRLPAMNDMMDVVGVTAAIQAQPPIAGDDALAGVSVDAIHTIPPLLALPYNAAEQHQLSW